jgi:hypothetical protein
MSANLNEQVESRRICCVCILFFVLMLTMCSVEYLEGIYKRCSLVLQVWVYGSSYKRFLVCVVVPDPETFVPWAKSKGFEVS